MNNQEPTPEEKEAVRQELLSQFDDPELEWFCLSHFPKVYETFSRGLRRDEKVRYLVDHCRRVPNEWSRLEQLLQDAEVYQRPPLTAREAYLLNLVQRWREWSKKYIPISGEPKDTYRRSATEPEGFISTTLATVFERHFPSGQKAERTQFEAIEQALDVYPQFLLLGSPGAGKTTILRKLLYDAAKAVLNDPRKSVPVYIHLEKDWPDDIKDVSSLLHRFYKTHSLRRLHPSEIFVLFDGLNEIQHQYQEERMRELHEWISIHHTTPAVIACRTNYYLPDFLLDIPRIKINKLDNARIRTYLVVTLGENHAEALLRRLQPNPNQQSLRDLIRLARNPYFLSMITHIYKKQNRSLPSSQGTLFQIFVEVLYRREQERGTAGDLTLDDTLAGLGEVAFSMHQLGVSSSKMHTVWGKRQLPARLKPCSEQLWYLGREMGIVKLSKDGRLFEFAHDLLTEYFAAECLRNSLHESTQLLNPPAFENGRRLPSAWDEIVYMLAGIVSVDAMFPSILESDPFLAARSLDYLSDEKRLHDETIDKIIVSLIKYLSARDASARDASTKELIRFPYQTRVLSHMRLCLKDGNVVERRAAIEVLQHNPHTDQVADILANALTDRDKWVRRDAADALVELGDPAIEPLRSLYKRSRSSLTRREAVKLWARIPSEKSIQYLFDALNDSNTSVARIASHNLMFSDEDEIAAIIEEAVFRRRQARRALSSAERSERELAVIMLAAVGTKQDATHLVTVLNQAQDERFQRLVIDALGQLGSKNDEYIVEALVDILDNYEDTSMDPRNSLRVEAARVLGLLRNERAAPSLQRALRDGWNHFLRATAAQALGRLRTDTVVDLLIERCETDWNHFVRSNAALALGLIGEETATIPTLVQLLSAKEERLRSYTIWGLALLRQPALMPYIIDRLVDPNHYVRQCTAQGLAILRDPDACDPLNEVIRKDNNHYVRQWATLSLGAIGHPDGLPALQYAAHDESRYVRHKAIAALGEIQHPDSGAIIHSAIQNHAPDRFCRQQAILALSRLRDHKHSDVLRQMVNDRSEHVRAAVAQAYGQMGEPHTVPYLIKMLSDDPSHLVRENAAEALGQIGKKDEQVISALTHALNDSVDFVRRFAVSAIGNLEITEAATELTELLRTDSSKFVRREIVKVLADLCDTPEEKTVKTALSDSDPNIRRLAAHHFRHTDTSTNSDELVNGPGQDTLIASRKTPYESAYRKIEEGKVYEVIRQAILDPRKTKRKAARATLWPTST